MANKWVYMFSEGDMTMRNLLGGKGANLAEMTSIGLPVPQEVRRSEQSAAGFRSFRRTCIHAWYDGHYPEPGSE